LEYKNGTGISTRIVADTGTGTSYTDVARGVQHCLSASLEKDCQNDDN